MASKEIKCAACDVPVETVGEPNAKSIWTCPRCGISDTHENVLAEVQDYVAEKSAAYLDRAFADAARRSKSMKFTPGRRHRRTYRFKVDFDL